MKLWLLCFLCLCWSSVLSQSVFQSSDVDSVAKPRGDTALFNTFIQATLRKPIQAESAGIGGIVVVSGIIETNGRIADVRVLRSLRPDCDREAVRVFGLFNAWKPAQKEGKAVRQYVMMPITFPPNTPFIYANGVRTDYYGPDLKIILDSSRALYKRVVSIDTNGVPIKDGIIYKIKNKAWKEHLRPQLVRYKIDDVSLFDKVLYSVSIQSMGKKFNGNEFIVDKDGKLFGKSYKEDGELVGPKLTFYNNGSVAERQDRVGEKFAIVTWYMNGQVKEVKIDIGSIILTQNAPDQVTSFWDSTG